ncbi:hypothetical protein I316_06390 [Kwoniella heveanensis BCC8398]|uniref:Zn(2)-C6 fungal-type domain-containing protein n=1 Tax=Kwoniella heveanensis BCC8398 TaxID=1296120 RepID=A0A1B9GLN5_9TREE|nr:hypothetical protein I316_06390 [Kwoniella heveanensis BCC8398]
MSLASSTSSFLSAPLERRRRVPDALRQRIEISCDRCKKRKRKCTRPDEDEACVACSQAGAACISTLPRKRRNLPSRSKRYATLDAIVRKLYPDEEVDTVEGLAGIAERLGIEVAELVGAHGQTSGESIEPWSPSAQNPASFENPELPPEGYLVPAPRGGHHYVGPASLVYFAKCVRHLVAKSNTLKKPSYDEAGLRRYLQAAEFTAYKVSHTIEANIQGHPATFAAGHEQALSVTSPADLRSETSPNGTASRDIRLPERAISDALVNAFFDRVHPNFPVLHKGAFLVSYKQSLAYIDHTTDPGDACTVYMVLTLGAQALEGVLGQSQALQQTYLSIVIREGLGRLVLTSNLANVQALLLLSLYQHNAGERNTAWILIGQAIRAAVASGLHRDGENCDLNPFERNIRRVVWWTLHTFEQTVSLALGRPSFSDVINVNAKIPETLFETGIGLPAGYLQHYVSLSHFMVKIKKINAILSVHYQEPRQLVERYAGVIAIHAEIINWKKSLPDSLSLGQSFETPIHRRLVLLLLIWADYLESVLCRPYLLARVHQDLEQSVQSSEIGEVAGLSVSAAHASVTKLLILAEYGLLESSVWLDFYCAQHAIMVVSLHFLGQPCSTEWDDTRESIASLISVSQTMRLAPTYRITMNVALQLSCIAGIGPEIPVSLGTEPPHRSDVSLKPNLSQSHLLSGIDMDSFSQLEQIFGPVPHPVDQSEPAMYGDLYNLGYMDETSNPWDFFDIGSFTGDTLQTLPESDPAAEVTHGYEGQ